MNAVTTEVPRVSDALTIAVRELEPESATSLRSAFETMFSSAEEWAERARAIRVTSVEQKREMKLARESRLALREIRVKAEHARKRLKEDSVRRGKAIDGIANVLKALIEPIEAHLLEQETFAERAEAERKRALRAAREDALRAYGADPSVFANLGESSEETWEEILRGAREAQEAKIEAERQAEIVRVEAERIAAEKRAKAREEAARLEAERAAREKAIAEENERLAAAKAEAEREAAAAREAAERTARELAATLEAAAKADAERAAAERERKAKKEAERVEAEKAPDRLKLMTFAAAIRALPVPTLTSEQGAVARADVAKQVAKLAAWIEKVGGAL